MDFQSFLLLGTDSVSGEAMLTSDTAMIMEYYGCVQEIRFNPEERLHCCPESRRVSSVV